MKNAALNLNYSFCTSISATGYWKHINFLFRCNFLWRRVFFSSEKFNALILIKWITQWFIDVFSSMNYRMNQVLMTIRLSNVSTHVSTLKYNKKKLSINNLKMYIECDIRHLVLNHVLHSQYWDKLFIFINSMSLAGQTSTAQTGPWYWVNRDK